jgi:hypothetical protein
MKTETKSKTLGDCPRNPVKIKALCHVFFLKTLEYRPAKFALLVEILAAEI